MDLTPAQRIDLISEGAELLAKQDEPRVDLILRQFGVSTARAWDWDSLNGYAISMLEGVDSAVLVAVHEYLTGRSSGARPGESPWNSDRLRLFCSHLAVHRGLVGEVAKGLDRFGIDHFVAHTSIEPSKEWREVIEAGLSDCDAMAVFEHPGFHDSPWCDQEVGWALGRGVPVLALEFGEHPRGFLGARQDQPCQGLAPYLIARNVATWLVGQRRLHSRLAASLTMAWRDSGSWGHSRELAPLMAAINTYTEDQLGVIEQAAQDNRNVSLLDIGGTSGPEWVAAFVAERRAPAEVAPNSAGALGEPPF